ncbi:HNH endonuclease [Paludisphaera mucosa]|uniref:HNH endonuclease n=1 Tax=Paludisphaera mucosa TaxID=3030827 RepID=A0ABT6F4R1_9BACT|nr:HNH endonuclease [Paludisphaera mucosa]MDG3002573.1 HNH endonuclease [Paludisphaera mucosa]
MTPIAYQGEERAIVEKYNATRPQDPRFWDCDEAKRVNQRVKKHYVQEQGRLCCYCRKPIASGHGRLWDTDHIIPKSKHPEFMFEPANLAISCIDCNSAKSDKLVTKEPFVRQFPKHASLYSIVHPHFDDYGAHILIYLGKIYASITPKGSFTILTCKLERYNAEAQGWRPDFIDDDAGIQYLNSIMNGDPKEKNYVYMEMLLRAGITVTDTLAAKMKSGPTPGQASASSPSK